ncbi:MAG: hypothetical protein JWO09_2345 [Bacteroidetes bacterium]|nr:hypothetical protein [Bacteroidota bacterium]
MLRQLIIKGLGTSIFQIVCYVILITVGTTIGNYFGRPLHRSVSWGLTLQFSIIVLSGIVILLNVVTTVLNRTKFTWAALAVVSICYIIFWAKDYHAYPNKTLFLIGIGLTSILTKVYIDAKIEDLQLAQ